MAETISQRDAITSWLATNFLDTRKQAGYLVAELDRRLPNRECCISISTSTTISVLNRSNDSIDALAEKFQKKADWLKKIPEAETTSMDESNIVYCAKIPKMPSRDLEMLFMYGPANKIQDNIDAVRRVFAGIEQQIGECSEDLRESGTVLTETDGEET